MKQIIKADQQKQYVRWLKDHGVTHRRPLFLLSLLALLAFITQLFLFWQIADIAQLVIVDRIAITYQNLIFLAITMLVLLVIERTRLFLSTKTEKALFRALQSTFQTRLSSGQYALVRQHSTYFWQEIWLNQLPIIAQFNVHYLVQQRVAIAVPFIVLACVFPINWLVGLSMVVSLPVVPLFMIVIGKGTSVLHHRHFRALSRLGSIFVDRIRALELLRIFDAHDGQIKTLATASDGLNQRTMRVVAVAFLSATVLDFFSTLAVALVAVFVGFNLLGEFTVGGHMTLHTGLFLLLTAPLCFAELKQLGRLYHLRAEALAVAETLMPIFSETPLNSTDIDQSKIHKIPTINANADQFEHISWDNFHVQVPSIYAEHIELKKNDWVWLKGISGSGKTCFLEALMGQRPSTHCFKHAVLISQQAVILPITIRDNLALGRQVNDHILLDALEQVELISWFKDQREGLDTVLDEHIPMSGGQQQRLALARVLLSCAQVIFLDEPTAHLTQEQHSRLSKMIRSNFSNRTVIWASHKPLINDWFDREWLMSEGELTT